MLHRSERSRAVALCLAVASLTASSCGGGAREARARAAPTEGPEPSRAATARTAERARDRTSITDDDVASAVSRRIARAEEIAPNAITVAVDDGVVTLTGTVETLLAARRAAGIASHTRGVRAVVDRVDVRPPSRDDAIVASDVERALEHSPVTGGRALEAEVERGRVTLRGTVESIPELEIAGALAAGVRGVTAVTNRIEIVPARSRPDAELRAEIVARMQRDLRIDPRRVEVHVEDGVVTLRGAVASAEEKTLARWMASVAGVREVHDDALAVEWWARGSMRRVEAPAWAASDADVAAAVRDALRADPRVRADELRVRVNAGIATLEGTVESVVARRAASEDALNVIGVWRVNDQLAVLPQPMVSDPDVEARVGEALGASPYVERESIDVRVRNGEVVLLGDARSRRAREEAGRVAGEVGGVRGVDNRVEVAGWEPLEDWELAAGIRSDLAWNPYIGRMNVRVEVEDGVATLTGEVDDVRAYREAEHEALDAGATHVVNELRVRELGGRPEVLRGPAPQPERTQPR